MNELFDLPPTNKDCIGETCRHCKHRGRFQDYHSIRVTQHCMKQPTRRNSAGYKRIKVHDKACLMFEKL